LVLTDPSPGARVDPITRVESWCRETGRPRSEEMIGSVVRTIPVHLPPRLEDWSSRRVWKATVGSYKLRMTVRLLDGWCDVWRRLSGWRDVNLWGFFGVKWRELLDLLDPTVGRVVTLCLPRLFRAINRGLNSVETSRFHPEPCSDTRMSPIFMCRVCLPSKSYEVFSVLSYFFFFGCLFSSPRAPYVFVWPRPPLLPLQPKFCRSSSPNLAPFGGNNKGWWSEKFLRLVEYPWAGASPLGACLCGSQSVWDCVWLSDRGLHFWLFEEGLCLESGR